MSCLIILPIALATFVLVMARIDIGMREAKRHQERVQARLLAESAWVVAQSNPDAIPRSGGKPVEGRIEGIGGYRFSVSDPGGRHLLLARGEVDSNQPASGAATSSSNSFRVIAEMRIVLPVQRDRLLVPVPLDVTYRVDAGAK